jgi:anthranilate 1,2-dioxygenase large subunit
MAEGDRFPVSSHNGESELPPELKWPDSLEYIPDWVFTDPRIFALEQERLFRGRAWNYVGLEAELPKPGDFIRSYAGSTPLIITRDESGSVRAFENRCAHRGVEFCKTYRGNAKQFMCPYHQWTYDLKGRLIGVPFRRGLNGLGGMAPDFKLEEHNLRPLTVASRGGALFASFTEDVEPLEEYLGPEVCEQFDTIFSGRPLKVHGYHRNILPFNWKLYQENLKDAYHATLLHAYLTTFGLFSADNKTVILTDATGRHHVSLTARPTARPKLDDAKKQMGSFNEAMPLHDPRVIKFIKEFDDPWSGAPITIWPNLVVTRQTNLLVNRQIVPLDPGKTMLIWTSFGFADDSEEMTAHRLRQNNLFGPGGFLGIDDNEALKFVQDGLEHSVARDGLALMGRDDENVETTITERPLRAMYRFYRQAMGL